MIAHDRGFEAVSAVVILALLTSCHSAPSRLYTLEPVGNPVVTHYSGPALHIDAVHLPPSMDRIEILNEVAPGKLHINDFDHWAAPLGRLVRQTLTDDLIARLPQGRVIFPHLEKSPAAIGINVDILSFHADERGTRLEASWSVNPEKITAEAGARMVIIQNEIPSVGAAATVQALSTMLGRLADRIAEDFADAPK